MGYALKQRLREAFFNRDLGPPTTTGTQFIRVGVASHQRRLVALDVIVRGFISEPTIEYFSDHSLRYHIDPKSKQILGVVPYTREIRPYCMVTSDHRWVYLLTPLCRSCMRPHTEHPRDKCLFEPTQWMEHELDDTKYIEKGSYA